MVDNDARFQRRRRVARLTEKSEFRRARARDAFKLDEAPRVIDRTTYRDDYFRALARAYYSRDSYEMPEQVVITSGTKTYERDVDIVWRIREDTCV